MQGKPEWHAQQGQKGFMREARYLAAQPLSLSTSLNLAFRSSSRIIHRRLIHILNKKNISNYIQPFLI